MPKIGLKLWSTNANYLLPALELYQKGVYDYIELYSVPDSYNDNIHLWRYLKIPFVIHAPHFKDGVNLSSEGAKEINKKIAFEVYRFADVLSADKIIFHPGVNGLLDETIRQLKTLFDPRILIENKPRFGNGENLNCIGYSPNEIYRIKNETGVGFCLDFGHAICAARGLDLEPLPFIEKFLKLKPDMFHLTDGDYFSIYDKHEHYGQGNFPIKDLITFIPNYAWVTNESVKSSKVNLLDFEQDIDYLKNSRWYKPE